MGRSSNPRTISGRWTALLCAALFGFACTGTGDPTASPAPSPTPTAPATTPTPSPSATPTPQPASACTETATRIECPFATTTLATGAFSNELRDLHWQVPITSPPPAGYPAVLLFQGSFIEAERFFVAEPDEDFGLWHQVEVTRALLDAGFAVFAPETRGDSLTYWDTNLPPYNLSWEIAPDHFFMVDIFAGIDGGSFGQIDPTRMYAAGLSSGGYMVSRMALSYPGRFDALAIMAASWATCIGTICAMPPAFPPDHPPTLFLHGELDETAPASTMLPYEEGLRLLGIDTRLVLDPAAEHEWLDVSADEVSGWFEGH